jgi:hypothetical protein
MKNNSRIFTFIAFTSIILISFTSITLFSVMIANTPENIVPTNVAANPMTMEIYKPDGTTLIQGGILTDASGKASYVDPNKVYSPVQAICSDTWLSDINAVPITDGNSPGVQESFSLPIYDGDRVFTVQVVYHYIVWMTVEVVMRSGPANAFNYVPSTTIVSPLAGIAVNSFGQQAFASETLGALTMWKYDEYITPPVNTHYQTNTMNAPHLPGYTSAVSTHPGAASVSTSLVPHATWQEMLTTTPSNPSLSATTVAKLANIGSAKPVIAKVTMHVDANTREIETYANEYQYTLANGTTVSVNVDTVSAVVGFSGKPNGLRSTGTYTGIVPNVNPLHQVPTFDLGNPSVVYANTAAVNQPATQTTPTLSTKSVRIDGSMVALATYQQEILAGQAVVGTPTGSMTYTTGTPAEEQTSPAILDLTDISGNCNLDQSLNVTVSNLIGPKLQSQNVVATLTSQMAYSISAVAPAWTIDTTTQYLQWAYGLVADNNMIAQNFTFPVDVVSERAVQLFSSDGHPIDLTTIVDTDANSIFNDPRLDNIWVHQDTPDLPEYCPSMWFDTWNWFVCVTKGAVIVVIGFLVLIAALFVLWVYFKVRNTIRG